MSRRSTQASPINSAGSTSREEQLALRLADNSVELSSKLKLLIDLRDGLDSLPARDPYVSFLEHLLPVLISQLSQDAPVPPNFYPQSNEHRYRQLLLECVQRIPQIEALKTQVSDLLKMLLHVIRNDAEDIAVLACKHAIDLFRTYKEQLLPSAEDFLALIKECYSCMDGVVDKVFGASTGDASPSRSSDDQPSSAATAASANAVQPRGQESFKLLAETPVVIVFLFQTYRHLVAKETVPYLPLIFHFLLLSPAAQAQAHAEAEQQGRLFMGLAPAIQNRRTQFSDLVMAQVKSMSLIAYILRMNVPELGQYRSQIPDIIIRMLKDLPIDATAGRKELLIAIRHVVASEYKTTFTPYIDLIINERILIGNGLTAHESLRTLAYSITTDLVHHVRSELSSNQLSIVVHKHTTHLHDPALPFGIQTMCSKLLINLIGHIMTKERDMAAPLLTRILEAFIRKIESLGLIRGEWPKWNRPHRPREEYWDIYIDSPTVVIDPAPEPKSDSESPTPPVASTSAVPMDVDPVLPKDDSQPKTRTSFDDIDVERCRPIGAIYAIAHTAGDPLSEARTLFKNLLLAIKAILAAMKHIHAPMPESPMMARLFIGGLRCMSMIDSRPRPPVKQEGKLDLKETCEAFCELFSSMDMLNFTAMWELLVPYAYETQKAQQQSPLAPAQDRPATAEGESETSLVVAAPPVVTDKPILLLEVMLEEILHSSHELILIPQILLSNRDFSSSFVGILLRFLVTLLPSLGSRDSASSGLIIRLYKMSFMAVTIFPESNEGILLPHLPHIIMQSLQYAGQATQPITYYLLLRALFRSIGGGRFENLYKAVLPLLQTVLETLNSLLITTDRLKKDLFVELCLTVPVRLSVLLPYLSYLMKPLVFALESGTDLVAQGLRTLELCVNNLTQEFLGPLMAPVIDDVMAALWKLLKPTPPASPQYAHQTVRILGKIGGRNRRTTPPKLEWKTSSTDLEMLLNFDGKPNAIKMGPILELACRTLKRGDVHYRVQAFAFLKHAATCCLRSTLQVAEFEDSFTLVLKGLLDSTKAEESAKEATEFLYNFINHICELELGRDIAENNLNRHALPMIAVTLDALSDYLSNSEGPDLDRVANQICTIFQSLIHSTILGKERVVPVLRQFAARLSSLCYSQSWQHKSGGAVGLEVLTSRLQVGANWLQTHELEIIRALLFMLKDAPSEEPPNLQFVVRILLNVIRNCQIIRPDTASPQDGSRLAYLNGLLIIELASQSKIVREVTKQILQIISESTGRPIAALLGPVKERLYPSIFGKPLRALAFPMQIANIEAITYAVTLQPPLMDFDKAEQQGQTAAEQPNQPNAQTSGSDAALYRLLIEALGIADAEDSALTGKTIQYKNTTLLTQLRISCVHLLSAAMTSPEFGLPRQANTRGRILSVYFKLLYKPQEEVVAAAYEALKVAMSEAGKLPKDLLQAGLRPVLMNLADHRKLDVACLEGLARLLELMTTYFKVEIGQKLLDHFRAISSDLTTLTHAAINANGGSELNILAAIVNIFRLLPQPASKTFMAELCGLVITVEAHLKKAGPTVFTIPLARYLSKYPEDTIQFYCARLGEDAQYARSFRTILNASDSEALRLYVIDKSEGIFAPLFGSDPRPQEDDTPRLPWRGPLHAAQVILDLSRSNATELFSHLKLIGMCLSRWVSADRRNRLLAEDQSHIDQIEEDDVILAFFMAYIKHPSTRYGSVDLIFHVLSVFTISGPRCLYTLTQFLHENVLVSRDIAWKKQILNRFVSLIEEPKASEPHKASILKNLINPLLLISFSRGHAEDGVVDIDFIKRVQEKLWTVGSNSALVTERGWSESLRVELLFMTTLLIRRLGHHINDFRKEVIKFAWTNFQQEYDPTVVQSGAVLAAQFIREYDCQPKVYLSVFNKLLKAHQSEAKALIREALGIFASAVSYKHGKYSNENPPLWLKAIRQLLVDEPNSGSPLSLHVFQFIIQHQELFFPRRDLFVAPIVSSLNRLALGPPPVVNLETRSLAIELISTILAWEQERCRITKEEESKMEIDNEEEAVSRKARTDTRADSAAPSSSSTPSGPSWQIPHAARETILHCLVKTIVHLSEGPPKPTHVIRRGLSLLKTFLSSEIWPEQNVRLSVFQHPLGRSDVSETSIQVFVTGGDMLDIVVKARTDASVLEHAGVLLKVIEKGMASTEAAIHLSFSPVLERLFYVLRDVVVDEKKGDGENAEMDNATVATNSSTDEASAVVQSVSQQIDEGLRNMGNLNSTVTLLAAFSKDRPERIDPYLQSLVRVLSRLTKEHLSNTIPEPSADSHRLLLQTTIDIISARMDFLGDQRRWLLSALVQLIEKSPSVPFCRYFLKLVETWVMDRTAAFPTAKEKAGLLAKAMTIETRSDENLLKEFFELILTIYKDPTFSRTELTVRLEQAFLMGCRSRDAVIRCQFMDLFDKSISRTLFTRLHYLIGVQSWEALSDTNWIHQALDLLLGAADGEVVLLPETASGNHADLGFVASLGKLKSGEMVASARKLLYADASVTQAVWIDTFQTAWPRLNKNQQNDLTRYFISLLSKDYHLRGIDRRPNHIQTLLSGLKVCLPMPILPPHLVRYLGRTYNAWYTSLEMLQGALEDYREESNVIQETTLDALAELYADLCEDDMYYGLWRRRSFYPETNIALSFEQNGMWLQALQMYEAAQVKARTGLMPFTESEYAVWEDHWVICAQKLQHWEILSDLSRHEGNTDLLLECSWRLLDWTKDKDQIEQALEHLPPVATPRRRAFEAFTALVTNSMDNSYLRQYNTGVDLALRKWYYLPEVVGPAHMPLLHIFQQFVELTEAAQIFSSLQNTNPTNLDTRSQELKVVLQTWRERLPAESDDINIWSDLVAWRTHVFSAINNTYLPLLPDINRAAQNGANGGNSSYAYRGYHETAWIINRFAHVARKHHLTEVCINSLNKIYTLPNIEIQEAFLKLREQAKCHYQQPGELTQGLEVISNTNLAYFSNTQKAEFHTLKAMFLARLEVNDEAEQVFTTAVQMDQSFPKAWAEWAEWLDRRFKKSPGDYGLAAQALSSYMQAACLYKNGKVRKFLVRILWLLSIDDNAGTVAKAFENHKSDMPVWYWITFIPQLLLCLSHREARFAKQILTKIARAHPQAIFYQLRTIRDELAQVRRQYLAKSNAGGNSSDDKVSSPAKGDVEMPPPSNASSLSSSQPPNNGAFSLGNSNGISTNANGPRHPWEYVDELHQILKTAYPLLALTLEMIGDQIQARFKPSSDEDVYRIIAALLQDAMQQLSSRGPDASDTGQLSEVTQGNVQRFSESLTVGPLKDAFVADFLTKTPILQQYVTRLQKWRDRYETMLDRKSRKQNLESSSHWLIEFQYHKFDEIEVPGQYIKLEDNPQTFVRIGFFSPKYDFFSHHPFAVQSPAVRHCRREERVMQLFRLLNEPLSSKREARTRNLAFRMPVAVPLAPHVRLFESHPSSISLQDIYDKHCKDNDMGKDDPIIGFVESLRALSAVRSGLIGQDLDFARLESFNEISLKNFPDDILKRFMEQTMASPTDLWLARKQMTLDYAAFIFMTYIFWIAGRTPSRIHISRQTGCVHTIDVLAVLSAQRPDFHHVEPVPFRLTPNLQTFMTAVGIEGVLSSAILAIATALLETEGDLEQRLSIFVREEVIAWHHVHHKNPPEGAIRDFTNRNVEAVVNRAKLLSCLVEREKQPVGGVTSNHSILELITQATNPIKLSQADPLWLAWL